MRSEGGWLEGCVAWVGAGLGGPLDIAFRCLSTGGLLGLEGLSLLAHPQCLGRVLAPCLLSALSAGAVPVVEAVAASATKISWLKAT